MRFFFEPQDGSVPLSQPWLPYYIIQYMSYKVARYCLRFGMVILIQGVSLNEGCSAISVAVRESLRRTFR